MCKLYDADKEQDYLMKRTTEQLEHGKDQVKKLPITVQNEGLLYNPVNMHIEDHDRLYQKDLREKNKRRRFEVRYDVEADTRKEGMAQFEREQEMKLNKISMDRYKEQLQRGFDILTNDPLEAEGNIGAPSDQGSQPAEDASKTMVYEYYRTMQEKKRQPRVWSRAMNTVNKDFMSEDEKVALEREEEDRKKQALNTSKAHLTAMMRTAASQA
jgi:hypothetical protein